MSVIKDVRLTQVYIEKQKDAQWSVKMVIWKSLSLCKGHGRLNSQLIFRD